MSYQLLSLQIHLKLYSYVRPNSPHVVYTIEASICLGGHFNASFTIQDMCFGMFQTFVTGSSITNASLFAASRDIFIRMAILFGHAIVEERDKKADDSEIQLLFFLTL